MTLKRTAQGFFLAACLMFSSFVFAAEEQSSQAPAANIPADPIKMLKGVTENVLMALKQNHRSLEQNPNRIYPLVDKYILPYVDFNEMSLWVAGRTAWGKAPEKTKEAFMSAFKVLVVRTYATALNNYTNETVYFPPQKVDTNKDRIQVTSSISRGNKESIRLNYRLVKHEDQWLVYDIIIEGVSILQGFQAQFTDDIRQRGLDKVIAQIQEHNKKSET